MSAVDTEHTVERILQSRCERQVCGSTGTTGLGGFFTDWRPSWERSLSHLTHKAEEKLKHHLGTALMLSLHCCQVTWM